MRLVQLKKKRAAMAPRWKSTMKAVVVQMRPVSESARPMRTSARVFAGSVGSRAGEACSMWSRPEAGEGEAPRVSQVASVSASCEMLINCRLDSTVHFMSDLRHGASGGFRRVAGPPGSKSLKAGMQCLADDEKITFDGAWSRQVRHLGWTLTAPMTMGPAGTGHVGVADCQARPANSRVSVLTLTFSPSLMKVGTRSSRTVSRRASLVTAPAAVSPRTEGSV